MSIITWPIDLVPGAGTGWGQRRYDGTLESDITGARQDILLGPPRWTLSIQQPPDLDIVTAGRWQALVMQLRGRVNHLLAWDFGRPAPLGTWRGTMSLGASMAIGATTIQIASDASQAGRTLLPGDKLQIGTGLGTSQVVMVVSEATASGAGAGTIAIEPPARIALGSGTPVIWQRASAYFKAANSSQSWQYSEGSLFSSGLAIDLVEVWT